MRKNLISDVAGLTAEIVCAYVAKNPLPAAELPALMKSVHDALGQIINPSSAVETQVSKPVPAVSIKKSLTDDYIICLEDGQKFKSLRRRLSTKYNMTPDAYRAKWGLPADYPMVAPAYAKTRSTMALAFGFGRKDGVAPPAPVTPAPVSAPVKAAAKSARGGSKIAEDAPTPTTSVAKPVRRGRPSKAA